MNRLVDFAVSEVQSVSGVAGVHTGYVEPVVGEHFAQYAGYLAVGERDLARVGDREILRHAVRFHHLDDGEVAERQVKQFVIAETFQTAGRRLGIGHDNRRFPAVTVDEAQVFLGADGCAVEELAALEDAVLVETEARAGVRLRVSLVQHSVERAALELDNPHRVLVAVEGTLEKGQIYAGFRVVLLRQFGNVEKAVIDGQHVGRHSETDPFLGQVFVILHKLVFAVLYDKVGQRLV